MKNILLSIIMLCAIGMVSCSQEDNITAGARTSVDRVPVNFSSNTLKVRGNQWEKGDRINIVMKQAGKELSHNTSYLPNGELGEMGLYGTAYETKNGDGIFTPVNQDSIIYYPSDGSQVDFIAYYPHNKHPFMGSIAGRMLIHPGSYNNNTDIAMNDILYSNNAINLSKNNPNVIFNFVRKMSKIEINIHAGTGLTDNELKNINYSMFNMYLDGMFSIVDGNFYDLGTRDKYFGSGLRKSVDGKKLEIIVFPVSSFNGAFLSYGYPLDDNNNAIMTKGNWDIPLTNVETGKKYTLNLTLNRTIENKISIQASNKATITDWLDGGSSNGSGTIE